MSWAGSWTNNKIQEFNSANHTLRSLSTYIFPVLFEEWGLDVERIAQGIDAIQSGDLEALRRLG